MTLPTSGPISMADINVELYNASDFGLTLNHLDTGQILVVDRFEDHKLDNR